WLHRTSLLQENPDIPGGVQKGDAHAASGIASLWRFPYLLTSLFLSYLSLAMLCPLVRVGTRYFCQSCVAKSIPGKTSLPNEHFLLVLADTGGLNVFAQFTD